MIIAGAGGHALELLDVLMARGKTENLCFFDEINFEPELKDLFPILRTEEEVKEHFKKDPNYILGIGSPHLRYRFFQRFHDLGGNLNSVIGEGNVISRFSEGVEKADIFNLCFIGANTVFGKGTLINTGAQIHHDVEIGEFSVTNPGAVLLGKVKVGDFCSIGANATILPKIKIGNKVIVGAGAVVTKDVPDGVTVVGVPAKILPVNSSHK